MSKRILVSRGYGAGWSTWADGDKAKAIAEYQPIVDYVQADRPVLSGKPRRFYWESTPWEVREDWLHSDFAALVKQMMDELDLDYFFTGGANGLAVDTVDGPYLIEEYDGFESVRTSVDFWT